MKDLSLHFPPLIGYHPVIASVLTGGDMALLLAAMRVITKHGLAQEFVDEITKPEPKE